MINLLVYLALINIQGLIHVLRKFQLFLFSYLFFTGKLPLG
ncbi:hypothetical protein GXM_07608 [Nostoc sphaeroides CCNUC1]|uniref:Uncharacterized protein n=1 Tax=Nostoc sphaeroides CCNUC1 TaxID=2653204 RepID=A0A5P8WBX0_9NOSO|nr:hypothetical protein GXM_07608 [Nostoc sphaeroides CCNUC1]